jgi:Type II secretion system (T2SS), protein G
MKIRKGFVILALAVFSLAVLLLTQIHVIPPAAITKTRMQGIQNRIISTSGKQGELPKSLDNLPAWEDYDNGIMDGWGNRIIYEVTNGKSVRLTSLGRDGVAGGTGDDADVVVTFEIDFPLRAC